MAATLTPTREPPEVGVAEGTTLDDTGRTDETDDATGAETDDWRTDETGAGAAELETTGTTGGAEALEGAASGVSDSADDQASSEDEGAAGSSDGDGDASGVAEGEEEGEGEGEASPSPSPAAPSCGFTPLTSTQRCAMPASEDANVLPPTQSRQSANLDHSPAWRQPRPAGSHLADGHAAVAGRLGAARGVHGRKVRAAVHAVGGDVARVVGLALQELQDLGLGRRRGGHEGWCEHCHIG